MPDTRTSSAKPSMARGGSDDPGRQLTPDIFPIFSRSLRRVLGWWPAWKTLREGRARDRPGASEFVWAHKRAAYRPS
jgi:hypothetical protein